VSRRLSPILAGSGSAAISNCAGGDGASKQRGRPSTSQMMCGLTTDFTRTYPNLLIFQPWTAQLLDAMRTTPWVIGFA
jgi:hypothetical protein